MAKHDKPGQDANTPDTGTKGYHGRHRQEDKPADHDGRAVGNTDDSKRGRGLTDPKRS